MKTHQETLRHPRQHRRTIAGALIASTIAGVLALTGASPTAATYDDADDEKKVTICHVAGLASDPANHVTLNISVNAVYGPAGHFNENGTTQAGHEQDTLGACTPPPPPTPAWTMPTYPPFNPQACTEYRLEKSVSTWNSQTGLWSNWTDYDGAGPLDWGQMPTDMTGHHGDSPHEANGDRHFAYTVVDTRPMTTGDCTPAPQPDPSKLQLTFIQECGVFTPLTGPWTAPADVQFRLRNNNAVAVDYVLRQAGGGVVQQGKLQPGDTFVTFPYGARTLILETYNASGIKVYSETKAGGDTFLTTDGGAVKCLPTTPEPRIDVGSWVDGEFACDDTTVQQTRVVTTTTYVWDGDEFVGTTLQSTETRTRNLDADEIEVCSTEPPTTEPPTTQPPTTQPPTTQPPTTQPPTAQPPTAQPPTVEPIAEALPPSSSVATQGGQLPATSAVSATELPATGSTTWSTFLLALAALGAGAAFLRLSRRPV